MSLVEVLKNDWELIHVQREKADKYLKKYKAYRLITETSLLYIGIFILIALVITLSVYIDPYKIELLIAWLSIPILVLPLIVLKFKISKTIKILLVYLTIFLSVLLIFKKNSIGDFIGYEYIQGYKSWDTDAYDMYSDSEYEEHYFETDTWYGDLIMTAFGFLYSPLLALIPYLTWKFLNKIK